ncbi:methyltransferase, FkbM family [Cognatiyoonia sediminum]|uniref:Methyltransferase, FkbM family n=1 Tax=Cognatiyoonia sediminum TaxID=1508389 RepID=A0A1M5Q5A9_9RHOB|nr:FkbM family methyltransferase [Cognatiyoonia sediminum]SHH09106.1 methyltransferase, FkbM family [Cognatiyoonia sediminum]
MTPQDRIKSAREELLKAQKELNEALGSTKTRARAQIVQSLHEIGGMLSPARPFASQAGQDRVVDHIFKGKIGGTFIDVGGYDGVTGSNSLFFEKWRGWKGVLVEPVELHRTKAKAARQCPCLPYAVSADAGEAEFLTVESGFTQMSGLVSSYDTKLLSRVRSDQRHKESISKVETKPLAAILKEVGIEHPDFISLDIEGGEMDVLMSFPFEDHEVKTWSIENNNGSSELGKLMLSKGYRLIEFCGPDEVYAHQSLLPVSA